MTRYGRMRVGGAYATLLILLLSGLVTPSRAAEYQWDFAGNLDSTFGTGTLSYADASTQALTTFQTTDGSVVPHIAGEPATYMHVPAFTQLSEGYNVEFSATGPNGGGAYVNRYTMIFDLVFPNDLNWTPLFNTNPDNTNDADWYVVYDGSIGIAALGYSEVNQIAPDTWYRVAITVDLGAGRASYYVNGASVFELSGPSLLDGRFSLYSNADAGPDVRLFNEGDETGQYTHELLVSSFYFADRDLSPSEIFALGGPTAGGIFESIFVGDYNSDGVVNAADYIVWRNSFGQTGTGLPADGNGNQEIDADDYTLWKSHFGQTMGSGGLTSPTATVPEPSLVGICYLALVTWIARFRRASTI
jgi:hypothetical protein